MFTTVLCQRDLQHILSTWQGSDRDRADSWRLRREATCYVAPMRGVLKTDVAEGWVALKRPAIRNELSAPRSLKKRSASIILLFLDCRQLFHNPIMSGLPVIRPEPRIWKVLCPHCSLSELAIMHQARWRERFGSTSEGPTIPLPMKHDGLTRGFLYLS